MALRNVCRKLSIPMLVLTGLAGCRHKAVGPEAVATRPRGEAPTAESIRDEEIAHRRAELREIPPLGEGVNFTDQKGELWTKYPSGLMTHDLQRIDGPTPEWGQIVTVTYVANIPGVAKPFEHHGPDDPLSFPLGSKSYLKGFNMGISTMHVGYKRRIYVPAELAYGADGNRMLGIDPNQPLIYEVELLGVKGEPVPLADMPLVTPMGPPMPASMVAPASAPADSAPATRE